MTYKEILQEIEFWLDKEQPTVAQYRMLGELTIIFCDEYNSKWPPFVNGMFIAVVKKLEKADIENSFLENVKNSIADAVKRQEALALTL